MLSQGRVIYPSLPKDPQATWGCVDTRRIHAYLYRHIYVCVYVYTLGFRARGYHVLFDRSRLPCPLGPLGVHDELVATVAEAQGILAGFL